MERMWLPKNERSKAVRAFVGSEAAPRGQQQRDECSAVGCATVAAGALFEHHQLRGPQRYLHPPADQPCGTE
jgi:hypothetical protein